MLVKRSRLLLAFCYCLIIAAYLTVSCTGLCHLTLIASKFQKQIKENVLKRSLIIFIFEVTPMLTMIVISRWDPYLIFSMRISKGLCLRIITVLMEVWYHIMVDTVPSSLLEESSYNLGSKFGVYARQMATVFIRNHTVEKIPIC